MERQSIILKPLIAILIVIIIGAALYTFLPRGDDQNQPEEPVACTQEARLCPDGSYVGRVGPECEFAACPAPDDSTNGWLSTTTPSASFRYPASLNLTYVTLLDWPPSVQVSEEAFSCEEGGVVEERAGRTESRLINGKQYCVTEIAEGAAGSLYTEYAYAFGSNDNTVILTFSVRMPRCENYDDPERSQCAGEQKSAFDPDDLADQVAKTLSLR